MLPISLSNANPSSASLPSRRPSSISSFQSPSVLRFHGLVGPRCLRSSGVVGIVTAVTPRGMGYSSLPTLPRVSFRPSLLVPFAASHEEPKDSDIEVEKENDDIKYGAQESQEAWKKALASFKEQAIKMQSISQEAYDTYSKKAVVVLKETAEQLKIKADKAREDFSVIAKEIGEESKTYISTAAENSPEHVKEVVSTFTSSIDDVNDISTIRDYTVGIPYGLLLSLGGFLSFMITGSVPAIRFGILPGIALMALSVSSLRAQKQGRSYGLALKGQAAISSILLVKALSKKNPSFLSYLIFIISAGVTAFYIYRIVQNRNEHAEGSVQEPETES